MGFLRKVFGRADKDLPRRRVDVGTTDGARRYDVKIEMVGEHGRSRSADLQLVTDAAGEPIVEVKVVGESYRQDALRSISGPKMPLAKQELVGAVLRCEPTNEYDTNAVRVEVTGQLLGYVARETAALLAPALQTSFGGALQALGLIVGGWKDTYSEGHYGIRLWLRRTDCAHLGLAPGELDPTLLQPWPVIPQRTRGEVRLSPTATDLAAGAYGSQVTVTCEEHYQAAIIAAMPSDWETDRSWPLLVDLVIADCNPHSKHATKCVEVRINGTPVGFLTPAMTARHGGAIELACAKGSRVTATAKASRRTKAGSPLWRLKIDMADPGAAQR